MFDKSNYYRYLKTQVWREIKQLVKKGDGKICKYCGATRKLVVHHLTYEHIFKEIDFLSDLITLCEDCPNQIHGAKPKKKKVKNKPTRPKPKPVSEVFDSMWSPRRGKYKGGTPNKPKPLKKKKPKKKRNYPTNPKYSWQ